MLEVKTKDFIEYINTLKSERERHDHYKDCVDYATDMAVHAYGEKPERILERNRPRENPEVTEYRLESYEPKTKAKFQKALIVTKKMFNDTLYQIHWPNENVISQEENTLEYYMNDVLDVLGYMQEEGLKQVIAQPNGVFAVLPGRPQPEDQYPVPYLTSYEESRVLDYKTGEYYIIHIAGDLGTDGKILVFDEVGIYPFEERRDGQTTNFHLVEEDIFIHNFGEVPVWFHGGIMENGWYRSFYDAAIPFWNKAIAHDSDLDGVMINHAYPHMWVMEMDCKATGCFNGKVKDDSGKWNNCSSCMGTGKVFTKSPFEYYPINQEAFPNTEAVIPPLGFVSPDPSIIQQLKDTVKELMEEGMVALNMHVVTGMNQSGRAKEWDRTELYESIRTISDLMFDRHYAYAAWFISRYRYEYSIGAEGIKKIQPKISAPQNFDILTISDITEEIKFSESLSPTYRTALEKDAATKRFSASSEVSELLVAMLELDPFSGISRDTKMLMLADGTVRRRDVVISDNIKDFVERAAEENKNFYEMDRRKQQELMIAYAQEVIADAEPEPEVPVETPNE